VDEATSTRVVLELRKAGWPGARALTGGWKAWLESGATCRRQAMRAPPMPDGGRVGRRPVLSTRLRQLGRALAMRCPLCGARWPRRAWLMLAKTCPTCQVSLARNEHDAFLGAYTLNLFATLMVAVLVTMANVRWQGAPLTARVALSALAIGGFALAFYPLSQLLWLCIDAQFRPPVERDFDDGSGG
jgi:uncharacterized protein (DUF983 family)